MPTEYALYLRKSRADLEAEAHGEGDTLARHEHILMELAKSRALPIGAIDREIVSGERIANRPVMQQLLSEVEDGRWKGVLVTETSRLARGDTIDQGIVAQAFKFSGTLIVTPAKTYDPTQEADEDEYEGASPLLVIAIILLSFLVVFLVWVLVVKLMTSGILPNYDFGFARWFNAHVFELY